MNSELKTQNSKVGKKGLSLIEMIIAIAILVVALLSALVLATFGIRAGGESKMRVTAINLAREGVEVVRNIRDSNWIAGDNWLEGDLATTDDDIPFSHGAYPKFTSNTWTIIDTGSAWSDPPTIDFRVGVDGNDLYVQPLGGNTRTNFYRALDIEEVQAGTEIKVTCYVAYQERGRWHLVNVEDHLFNWY